MIISRSNGVLKANDPNTLSEFGGHITLTDDWAWDILQWMDWVKRKGTTGNDLRGLCAKNREIVIIPHNLTNKFQSLDPGVSKAAKTYVFEKRNT